MSIDREPVKTADLERGMWIVHPFKTEAVKVHKVLHHSAEGTVAVYFSYPGDHKPRTYMVVNDDRDITVLPRYKSGVYAS